MSKSEQETADKTEIVNLQDEPATRIFLMHYCLGYLNIFLVRITAAR